MSALKKVRGAFWRLVEWSTVMAALCWLFARAWTDEARHQRRLRDGRAATAEKPLAEVSRSGAAAQPRA